MSKHQGSGRRVRIVQLWDGSLNNFFWSASRREWQRDGGTTYKSIEHARADITRFGLTNCTVTT